MAFVIDSVHDILLNGYKFKVAESEEGSAYQRRNEPLRPPNAVTVQGESQQKFQPRPDTLLWNWTNWDEGEGRNQLRFGESGRSFEINNCRAFEKGGELHPGYFVGEVETGAGGSLGGLQLVVFQDTLYGLTGGSYYTYNGLNWGTASVLTGTAACDSNVVADGQYIYWVDVNQDVWKWDGSAAPVQIDNGGVTATSVIAEQGDYVYVYTPTTGVVHEIAKTPTSETVIDQFDEFGAGFLIAMDGVVYLVVGGTNDNTYVRKITPSSAAGTGFGNEIATLPGFVASSAWAHSGSIWMIGTNEDGYDTQAIMYYTPHETWGTVGALRPGTDLGTVRGGGQRMLDHFVVAASGFESGGAGLVQIDSISGGVGCVANPTTSGVSGAPTCDPVTHDGDIFWCTSTGTNKATPSQYSVGSSDGAVSPKHDFDLLAKKYLSTITVHCNEVPSGWTVYVQYQIDEDGTWNHGAVLFGDGSTKVVTGLISTDTETVNFHSLRLRIRMLYGGWLSGGGPSSAPIVYGVEVRAGVAEKVPVWRLMLDMNDEHSAGGRSRAGSQKVTDFLAAVDTDSVIQFRDGYNNRNSGQYTEHDVVVDTFALELDRPGEGIGYVELRKVIAADINYWPP